MAGGAGHAFKTNVACHPFKRECKLKQRSMNGRVERGDEERGRVGR